MKPKQLLGVALIAACVITAGLALKGTVRRSLTVQEVRASEGEPCGLYGEVVKGSGNYDMKAARLTFNLKDPKGDAINVVYNKPKPANFDQASHVKAVGAYRDGAFQADELVLKCPSKYISEPPAPTRPGEKRDPLATLQKGA